MAASSTDLMNKLLQRQKYCEEQTKLLQKQVAAFQRHFKVPQSEIGNVTLNVIDGFYVCRFVASSFL